MDLRLRSLNQLPARIRAAVVRQLRDRRMYVRLQFGSALGLGIGLLLAIALIFDILGAVPTRLSDFLFPTPAASGQVIIVAIDDASLKEIGPWPWPRATIAALVDALTPASPRVLGLDLIFPDPSNDDAALARALAKALSVIQPVLGVEATRHPASENTFQRFDFVLDPALTLQTPNTRLAHRMITPDADGVVRHLRVAIESTGRQYPAFSIAVLAQYQNRTLGTRIENRSVVFGTQQLPVDAHGQINIVFCNPATQPKISAAAVLRGRANLTMLRDRIVLIGLMHSAMPEYFITPLSPSQRVNSVEIHANMIETLLSNRFLVQQDRLTEIVMIFLLALLGGATLPHFRLLSAFALTIIYFVLYLGYAFDKFNSGVLVQPLYPLSALLLAFIGATIFRYFLQERRREALMRLFRRYVAPEAIDQVTRGFDEGALPLGGARRTVTILCLDLRDLTRLTGSLKPEAVFRLLDQYVALIVSVVFRYDGTVTQQSGEEIMAAWNLLLDQPDHVRQAVRVAVEIKQEIAAYNQKRPSALALAVGIGITTGEIIAGRIGSAAHTDYTVVGEIASVAERLAVKPERGVFIDAATFAQLGGIFQTREIKPIKLRRESDPHQVWQVLLPMDLTSEKEDIPANEI